MSSSLALVSICSRATSSSLQHVKILSACQITSCALASFKDSRVEWSVESDVINVQAPGI
jgi:hypothetical protein